MNNDETIVRVFDRNGRQQAERRVMRKRWSPEVRSRVWQRTDVICYLCKTFLPPKSPWHIEHVFAFSKDPTHNDVLGNLLPSCASCNCSKGTKSVLELLSNGRFSIASQVPWSQLSIQGRVKEIILHAIRLKHAARAAPAAPIVVDSDAVAAEWCDALEARVERQELPMLVVSSIDVAGATKIGSRGGQGVVFATTWANDDTLVKVCIKRHNVDVYLAREISLMGQVDHPHIVEYFGYLPAAGAQPCYTVMELLDGDLNSDAGQKLFFGDCQKHVVHLLSALAYLHANALIHRDLKPHNILYNQSKQAIKLADFGLARTFTPGELVTMTKVYTPGFRAPELSSPTPRLDDKTVIWMFGATMRALAQALHPSMAGSDKSFLDFLQAKTMMNHPQDRPTARELLRIVAYGEASPVKPQPSPSPSPPSEYVWVSSLSDTRGKYHSNENCRGTERITLAKALLQHRDACTYCQSSPTPSPPRPTTKMVWVTDLVDKRGKYHTDRNCFTLPSHSITLQTAQADGRGLCSWCENGGGGIGVSSPAKGTKATPAKAPTVFVSSLDDTRGKYHTQKGHFGATKSLLLSTAKRDGREPCSSCVSGAPLPSSPSSKKVYVTSTDDRRGMYHSKKGCYGANKAVSLSQAKKDGRSKHC